MEKKHLRIPSASIRASEVKKSRGGNAFFRDNYEEHGVQLLNSFRSVTSTAGQKKDSEVLEQVIVKVLTPENEAAKKHANKLKSLGFELITLSDKNKSSAVVSLPISSIEALDKKIERYATEETRPNKSYLSIIEQIIDVPVEDKVLLDIVDNNEIDFIITIYPFFKRQEKEIISSSIFKQLETHEAKNLKLLRFSSGMYTISGKAKRATLTEIGENYFSISSIIPNRSFITTQSNKGQELPLTFEVEQPSSNVNVVVIDSGIEPTCRALRPLIKKSLSYIPSYCLRPSTSHGTLVASRVAFGDDVTSVLRTNTLKPFCNIIDVNVFGDDGTGVVLGHQEDELANIIDTIVPSLVNEAKIFNLSLGAESIIENSRFSLLSSTLDYIAYTYKVLFVVSSGNFQLKKIGKSYPECFKDFNTRICPPAESLLSVTVGSIAKIVESGSLSKSNEISPFSRIGPGSDQGVKPELVAHGGNGFINYTGDVVASPVTAAYGLHTDGQSFAYDIGTSFAAPLIANYAARILSDIPDASPNLIKAFLIHFAESRVGCNDLEVENHHLVGFGETNINMCLSPTETAVTYYVDSSVDIDHYSSVVFHVPPVFTSGSNSPLTLRVTLVYDPPVNPNNMDQYSESWIGVNIFKRNGSVLSEVNFNPSDYRMYNSYNPVIKMEKTFKRNFGSGEWEIRLRGNSRGRKSHSFQTYAMIIEVIDPLSSLPVYNDVLNNWSSIYTETSSTRATG